MATLPEYGTGAAERDCPQGERMIPRQRDIKNFFIG
jgi:hypothetical protein